MGAKDLRERQRERWPQIKQRLEDAKPPRLTREELEQLIAGAQALGMTHVQIQVPRSRPPGARMRLDGRSSPWSDHRRGIEKVKPGLWSAWWSVEAVAAWLTGSS